MLAGQAAAPPANEGFVYFAHDLHPLTRLSHALLFYDQRGAGRSTLVTDSAALAGQRFVRVGQSEAGLGRWHLHAESALDCPLYNL
jgi:hypothetical protein